MQKKVMLSATKKKTFLLVDVLVVVFFFSLPSKARTYFYYSIWNERVLKEEGDCDEVVSFVIVGSKKNLIFLC